MNNCVKGILVVLLIGLGILCGCTEKPSVPHIVMPAVPTGFSAEPKDDISIYLNWTTTGYNVRAERNTIPSWSRGQGTVLINGTYSVINHNVSSYIDADGVVGLLPGKQYYYQLWFYNDSGFSVDSAKASTQTKPNLWVTNYVDHVVDYSYYASPVMDGNKIVACVGRSGQIFCLDKSTGAELWVTPISSWIECGSPAIADNRVFVGAEDHMLYCLDETNGYHLWTYDAGEPIRTTAMVVNNRVYFGSNYGRLICLNETNGNLLWQYATGQFILSSPVVSQNKVYFGTQENQAGTFYCLNATSGQVIWSNHTPGWFVSRPTVIGNRVYAGGDKMYCYNTSNGHVLWSYNTYDTYMPDPVVTEGRVYVRSGNYSLYCLNATSGYLIWKFSDPKQVTFHSIAVSGDRLYVGSDDLDRIYCFNATTGEVIKYLSVGAKVLAKPIIDNEKVYIFSQLEAKLYCFTNK